MVRILHLTDFHLNPKNLRDWKNHVKEKMLLKIKEHNAEHEITFVVFTGDMIDKGGKDYKNATEAFNIFKEEVIDPILNELQLPISCFLIIPGNHDVVRSKDSLRDEKGSTEYFKNANDLADFMENAMKKEDYTGMLRIKEYKEFEKNLYSESKKEEFLWTIFGNSFIIKNVSHTIGICCFNSAWRCFNKDDRGNLLMGELQLSTNIEFIKKCEAKIALVHHPLDGLAEVEKRIISDHIYKDFDLLLLGHSHETMTAVQTGTAGTLFINLAPSGINDIRSDSRSFSNGYTLIDFDKKKKEVDCTYWRYNHSKEEFVPNTDAGVGETGTAHYIIPDAPKESKKELIRSLLKNIKDDHYKIMDEHLIGMRADVVKKTLKEAFILPPIDEGKTAKEEELNEEILSINQIVKSSSNQFFLGNVESSKTTLLYRLVVEFVEEFEYLRKVPVYINFSDIGNKEIKTCIKEYLKCNTNDANYLLDTNQIILLIDNLKYEKSENNKYRLNTLHKFYFEHNNIQIIATSDCDIIGILPDEYLKQCKIPFRNFFIRNLRAREIKKLMGMWIPNEVEDEIKLDDKLERLVTNFTSYGLPSTAMSVSLFLWSTEHSKREPINSAVLLEIYIEIILDKLSKDNIYRKTFDFTNKMQLLARVAYEMLSVGESNYSISYSQFTTVVENYLKNLVGFTQYDPQVIIDYFFARKIFTKYDGDKIKFSNSCFFHFFLAKRMEFDSAFKATVLEEKEYYKYYREIDYYTGLKRSDKEVFDLIYYRFKKIFTPVEFVLGLGDIDKYFTPAGKQSNEPAAKSISINTITENRPSEQMLEEFHNKRLEQIENPGTIIKMDGELSLDRILIIMSNVLRNSEGIEELDLKREAYRAILKNAMIYMILHKESYIDYVLKNNRLPPSMPIEISFMHYLANIPLFVQGGLYKFLGTPKLNSVILEKINEDKKNRKVSDTESFLSVGLYADLQGSNFDKELKIFISRLKTEPDAHVVADYTLIKLIDYYYRRTRNNSPNEAMYLNLIAELRIRVQKLPKRLKERIIKSLKDAKKTFQIGLGNDNP